MIPKTFEFFAPKTLDEALHFLKKYEEAKIIAGGQSLVPMMKFRLIAPPQLIDLGKVSGLSYIRQVDDSIAIGAMTTHYSIESDPLVIERCKILSEAASVIGDVQVRNRGTIGGSLCHADPAADYPPVLLVLEAKMKALSLRGERVIQAQDFFVDMFTTSLERDEILTEIQVPVLDDGIGGAYLKFSRGFGDLAIVGVAALLAVDEHKMCKKAKVALTGVASKPVLVDVVKSLVGKVVDEATIKEVSEDVSRQLSPLSDVRASAEYRKEMVRVFTKRALIMALKRARGIKN